MYAHTHSSSFFFLAPFKPVIVAEKSMVVRGVGQLRMIMSSSSLKPTSSNRSASSMIRILRKCVRKVHKEKTKE